MVIYILKILNYEDASVCVGCSVCISFAQGNTYYAYHTDMLITLIMLL